MRATRYFVLGSLYFLLAVPSSFAQSRPARNQSNHVDDDLVDVGDLQMPAKAKQALAKAYAYLRKGDPKAALPYVEKSMALAPRSFYPYHNLGLAQLQLGNLEAAEENFNKAVALSKGKTGYPYFGLALVHLQRREFSEGQSLAEQGIVLSPNAAVGKYCLALFQYFAGRLAEAERNANEALRLVPNSPGVHLLLAYIHERIQKSEAAMAEIELCLKSNPSATVRAEALVLLQRVREENTGSAVGANGMD
ncbi:MAG TPA: tetratricopeptide repeat protein [Dongiaceae bacterium]|nr:tetratricopeptide repeat protein [Dongiaceae bacterium]